MNNVKVLLCCGFLLILQRQHAVKQVFNHSLMTQSLSLQTLPIIWKCREADDNPSHNIATEREQPEANSLLNIYSFVLHIAHFFQLYII